MYQCLICDKKFSTSRALYGHVRVHNMTSHEYKNRFGLLKRCFTCGTELAKNNQSGYCNSCRDRTGENNPFFGKTHKPETITAIKERTREASQALWQDPKYREKVISGVSKPRPESFKKEQSERMKQWYKDNPEQRKLRSKRMKRSWEEGVITQNNHQNSQRFSKLELQLFADLQEILGEDDVVWNKTVWGVDGRWMGPDFIVERLGVVIEFFGNYYHANPSIYSFDDIIINRTAQEVWDYDKDRIDRL